MRVFVRWLMRNVILFLSEEWVNAHQEVQMMQAVYHIKTLCDAEHRIFKVMLTDFERMQDEAMRAKAHFPAAQGLIDEMLQERLQHLAGTIQEDMAREHAVLLKTAR